MKSAIVTGANGFVGSTLVRELTANGVDVTAVVRNEQSNVSRLADIKNVRVIYCAMDDIRNLADKLDTGADVFYHMAWEGSTGPARADYGLQLKNVQGSLDAVHAAAAIGCSRFVGIGTLAEKDVWAYTPLDGATPNDVSCYGSAKIASHLMTKAECNKLGLEHLWAMLSNTYGIGNYTSNFINFASKLMITGQPANFTPAEQIYDFVNVADTALGLYKIGQRGRPYYSYYIGSTKPRKLKEFIRILRDTIDPSIQLNFGAVPFNGVIHPESVFDCTQLVEDTGYEPRVGFEDGIITTVEWLRSQIKEGRL